MIMSVLSSKRMIFWVIFLSVDAAYAIVFGKALNYPVELGHSLKLQCSISEDMGIQKNFRWADEGQFKKLDEPNKTKSTYEILLTEEYLGNRSVICYYGEYFHSFDARFFRTVFQYISEPEEGSMRYSYCPGLNNVKFEVNFPKIYPLPSCTLFGKQMNAVSSKEGQFYSVNYSIEWPLKIFRCSNLNPVCQLNDVVIPNGPLKTDCHEALKQSYWGVLSSVLYIIITAAILVIVNKFYRGEESTNTLDWDLSTKIQYLSAFSALFGNPFLFGYNMAVLNNPAVTIALSVMKDNESNSEMDVIKEFDESIMFNIFWSSGVVLYVFSGFFGILIASKVARTYGRKKPLMVNSLMMLIASIIGYFTTYPDETKYRILLFFLHRILIGFPCGCGLIISGMYIMEISKLTISNVKGSFGTYDRWFHFYITIGIVTATLFGTSYCFGNVERWHWLLALNCVPALFNFLLRWCPESPVDVYIKTRNVQLMEKELRKICVQEKLEGKSEQVIYVAEQLEGMQFTSVSNLMRDIKSRVRLIIVCYLQAAQQLSGVNVIVAFSSFIYQYAGVQFELAEWVVLGTALTNCISTFITLSTIQPRRKLLMLSTALMFFALFIQLITSQLCENFQRPCPFFAVTAVSLYIVAFSLGLGPIPYIMVQEMFEEKNQGAVFSISMGVNWISNSIVLFLFRILQMYLQSYIYALYMAVVLVLFLVIYVAVPETIGFEVADMKNSDQYKFVERIFNKKSDNDDDQSDPINRRSED